ncbi:hypothetical protein FQN60_015348 [Etheostoma spectabile]|uniref:Triacylglycerol lipase n=1 Tax=Etheostoma spectabile TaxID=54343 RepID=A0A5J5CUD4_9PERO|nr:hypothetical protein FQN60_015348 [Etheostoma spectabile]
MSHMWSLLCFLIGISYAAEVCFNELGCFSDLPPWGGTEQRPVSVLPWQPDAIGTRFLLFTQKNRYYQAREDDEDWPQEMCKTMLKVENVNCIAVEWKKGVKTQYAQAANNARVLGAQVAFMIQFLKVNFTQTSDKFHIIGHSVGAHAAGDAGSRTPGLARITGLDPTEPYFQDTDVSVRLDTSDAAFVDVIHTDGSLGMSQSVGHVDFYPNGGELMPGCSANKGLPSSLDAIWEGTKRFDACNHARAYEYYSESLRKRQGFVAYPCPNKDSFAAGKCFPCGDDTCPQMGYYADRFNVTNGISETKYFLNTGSSEPFGREYPAIPWKWDLLTQGFGTLKPGRTYEMLIDAEVDIGEATEVRFRWNNHILNPLRPKYGASKVELQRGRDNQIVFFCGIERVAEDTIQHVLPC